MIQQELKKITKLQLVEQLEEWKDNATRLGNRLNDCESELKDSEKQVNKLQKNKEAISDIIKSVSLFLNVMYPLKEAERDQYGNFNLTRDTDEVTRFLEEIIKICEKSNYDESQNKYGQIGRY